MICSFIYLDVFDHPGAAEQAVNITLTYDHLINVSIANMVITY